MVEKTRRAGSDFDVEEIRRILDYNSESGIFTWKVNRSRLAMKGDIAGMYSEKGYRIVKVKGSDIFCQRLAWFLYYGVWPEGEMDHINGIRDDNRISNLRVVTRKQNRANTGPRANSSSKYKGVHWCKSRNKWRVTIKADGVQRSQGRYDSEDKAAIVYNLIAEQVHGPLARLNKVEVYSEREAA